MKKWNKWKKGIAIVLAGATFLSSMPAAAENLFTDGTGMAAEETVSAEGIPAEAPVTVEEPPVVEEAPTAEEPPVVEETPTAEEGPIVEEPPIVEAAPLVEEPLVMETPPVTEEPPMEETPPAAEEPPATEDTSAEAGDLFTDGTGDVPAGDAPVVEPGEGDVSIEEPGTGEVPNTDIPGVPGTGDVPTEEVPEPEKTYPVYTSPALAELGNLAWNEAGAATEAPEAVIPVESQVYNWFFQSFYVQEENTNYVTKNQEFLLKYQMEFYTDCDLDDPFDVVIRIPKILLWQQSGEERFPVDPAVVGVPRCEFAGDGSRIDILSPVTPFNYYEETGADGVDYLVFYNYQPIQAGIGTAFQVAYGPVDVTTVADGTAWSLIPTLQIQGGEAAAYPALEGMIELPEPTPTVTPEPTPTAIPEELPEPEPTAPPEELTQAEPSVIPEETPELTPTVIPEAAPPEIPEAAPTETPQTIPSVTPEVTPTEAPEATPTVIPEPTPTIMPEPTEAPEYPTYDSMSIADLADLDEETVGAATETPGNMAVSFFAADPEVEKTPTWSFDAYYVGQEDPHHVYKEQDFSLKYQMEFHTDYDLQPGDVEIRIPRMLLREREKDGHKEILPSDIAVPQGGKNPDGSYIAVESRVTPFNYYVDGENLVFYNYKLLQAGTNAAWQVLYKGLDVSRIVDGTTWTLTPEITIKKREEVPQDPGTAPAENTGETIENRQTTPLTGEVHTTATLKSVTKDVLNITGKSYGPGLYTKSQVERVLGRTLEGEFADNFDNYVFVGWKVSVDVDVVQPVSLTFRDTTSYGEVGQETPGSLVGVNLGEAREDGSYIEYYTEENAADDKRYRDGIRNIQVVTAYPKEAVKPGTPVRNDFAVEMELFDNKTVQTKTDNASWIYKDYYFTWDGEIYQAWKEGESSYPGWLNVFEQINASENQEAEAETYLDAFPFTTKTYVRGYGLTHYVNSKEPKTLGERIPESCYQVETMDGFFKYDGTPIEGSSNEADRTVTDGCSLHAYSNTDGDGSDVALGADDFYIKNVSVLRSDRAYDVWEDEYINAPEFDTGEKPVDQTISVWAAYEAPTDGAEPDWRLVCEIPWTEQKHYNSRSYSIDNGTLCAAGDGKYPIAIKTSYKSIAYESDCEVNFDVQLRYDSPRIKELLKNDNSKEKAITIWNTARNDFSYNSGQGSVQTTKSWNSLYRSEQKRVSLIGEDASSAKTATVSSDTINGRVLVDYNLTAWSGYNVYSKEVLNYLRAKNNIDEMLFPDLKEETGKQWIFYDLLPYGMTLDFTKPVTAGRITSLDSNGNYEKYPQSWDKTGVSVSVDPETDVIDDWKGTGRTMVKFHLSYDGEDPTVYTKQLWLEGWGVSFRARYDWEDLSLLEKDANISAFTPEDPSLALVGAQYGNGEIPEDTEEYKTDYGPFGQEEGIREDSAITSDVKNILYAKTRTTDDVAVASTSSIKKLVRADEDLLNDYGTTAVVEPSEPDGQKGGYTYDITVTSGGVGTKDIVIYDRLEYAVEDRTTEDTMDFDGKQSLNEVWQGEFVGLDTTELEAAGIDVKVYYNEKQSAARPRRTNIGAGQEDNETHATPDEVFNDLKSGWVRSTDWLKPLSEVRAVAVDLRTMKNDGAYILPAMESIGFKIKMKAPQTPDAQKPYTFNNPAYYSCPENSQAAEMVVGNSVRVELAQEKKDLEILKEFGNPQDVPKELQNQEFVFTITYPVINEGTPNEEYPPFAYQVYTLHRKDETTGGWKPVDDGQVRTTDKEGKLTLHAGEKAVFKDVRGSEKLLVTEEESPFWKTEKTDNKETAPNGEALVVGFKNTYRPVLYIQKKTQAVPEDKKEEVKDHTFVFEVKASYINAEGEEVHQSFDKGMTYWLVDAARTDGGIPNKLEEKNFNENGFLELKPGEIAAVFLDSPDSSYTVTEHLDKSSHGDDWLCREPEKSGQASIKGSKVEITNTYKWKELILLKEITHQDKEDVEAARKDLPFTFEVKEVVKGEDGTETEKAVTGKKWLLLNTDGSEPKDSERPDKVEEGETVSGELDNNGRFTCAMANRKVKIKGLEAGKTYVIYEVKTPDKELTPEQKEKLELYKPVNNGIVEVTMPVYSTGKGGTITNDYQMRPLTVSKQVLLGDAPTPQQIEAAKTREFTMTVKVNGIPLANKPYELQKNGQTIDKTTGADGSLTLKDGEGAYIKDAGLLGDTFEVRETPDTGDGSGIIFNQVYPPEKAPSEGNLAGEGGTASFINGIGGCLVVMKEYIGGDEKGTEIAGNITKTQERREEFAVEAEFVFYNEQGKEIRPDNMQDYEEGSQVTVIDLTTGTTSHFNWPARKRTLTLEPGEMYVLPEQILVGWEPYPEGGGLGDYATIASYRITEAKTDYGYLYREKDTETGTIITESWLHIRQKPQGAVTGTVKENPLAKLVNEITVPEWGTDDTLIEKRMALDAETHLPQDVAEGAVLTLRLERYQAKTKAWLPAEGVPYLQDDRMIWDLEGYHLEADYEVTEGSYGVTGSDGILTCVKRGGYFEFPVVYFPRNQVHLNLYGDTLPDGTELTDGTLRLVEVPELSDPAWGYLTGYGKAGTLSYSMTTTGGTILYNRIGGSPVDIEKAMETDSDETFTMLLKQVLSQSTDSITRPEHILKSQAVPGIPYIVYDRETGREVSRGQTGKNGEIYLKAGQYARLELSEDTKWTVEEQQSVTTALEKLEGTPGEKLAKLSDNLMLINQPGETLQVGTVTYDANGGRFRSDENAPTVLTVFYYMKNGKPERLNDTTGEPLPLRDDMEFDGWYREVGCTTPFDIKDYDCKEDITVYAGWKVPADVKYAVALYGIEADTYKNADGSIGIAGLTFGPATGADYRNDFVYHFPDGNTANGNAYRCLHEDTWKDIIKWSDEDPWVYEQCLKEGCTKAVKLTLNKQLKNPDYTDTAKNMTGDGAGILYASIDRRYLKWNNTEKNKGGWPVSRIRATLNGKDDLTDVDGVAGTDVLDETNCLLTCFPQELQDAIVAKAVKSDTVYSDYEESVAHGTNQTTYDKLWLFSEREYFKGSVDRLNEGIVYAGAKPYGGTAAIGYSEYKTAWFRLRTISPYSDHLICNVSNSGYVGTGLSDDDDNGGLSPGFCIK